MPWLIVRSAIVAMLFVAAMLKSYELIDPRWAVTEGTVTRGLNVFFALFEVALATWLLSGVRQVAAWATASVLFSLFFVVALFKAVVGEADCGCFGAVAIPPWWTALFDLAAVVTLLSCRRFVLANRCQGGSRRPSPTMFAIAIGIVVLVLPFATLLVAYQSSRVVVDAGWKEYSGLVILDPPAWEGKSFPLDRFIDIGDQIVEGRWRVALIHHDCGTCRELMRRFRNNVGEQAALIQIPPYGALSLPSSSVVKGHLTDTREWFVQTPVELVLEDGKVIAVRSPS